MGAKETLERITKGKSKAPKGAPRRKRSGGNDKPSRRNYWNSGKLRTRKIRNLMRCCGMTRAQAEARWNRSKRMK